MLVIESRAVSQLVSTWDFFIVVIESSAVTTRLVATAALASFPKSNLANL